jgi:transposase
MKRETITLDARAQWRLYVLNHILAGEISVAEAADRLGLSVRSVRRLLAYYRAPDGVARLVHGNAGRAPANRLSRATRDRLVELALTTYAGVNRAHLADLLAEREDITVSARTVRRVLGEAGLPAVRTRRPRGHRTRRERMSQMGLLLQVDGSRHDWLEGRGPWLTLVGGIDDATGIVTGAVFREQEDAAGYLEVLSQTARRHGLPVALYSDRHGIFWKNRQSVPTLAEQFAGRRSTTQFGRALEAAGIAWIAARSPQAKGRVERLWGTLQDRLTSELRLAGADSIDDANRVLADYLTRHNDRFAVPARELEPAWRPLDRPVEMLFCFRHARRLARDGTLTLGGRSLLVSGRRPGPAGPRSVTVEVRLDGSLWVDLDGYRLPLIDAPERPVVLRSTAPLKASAPPRPAVPQSSEHPWRRYPAVRPR